MVEFGRFGIVADGRQIRPGGGSFDVLMALIEASRAVVGKDELLSRVRQGRIVDENRQSGTRLPRCAKALAPTAS
jgi:DNA-binding winged helix-turn-helix (wHTH) protein